MVTTRISIKPHLKEYLIGKFSGFDVKKPVHFPRQTDIYLLIWDLMNKRPVNCPVDEGNLDIVLPERYGAKHPEYYNFLSRRSQKLIEQKIELMMWAEFREYMEIQKHEHGIPYIDSICQFISRYAIESLSEDAFKKNYYRWRNKVRKKEKRPYNRKKFE
jgi:hypothetical protein